MTSEVRHAVFLQLHQLATWSPRDVRSMCCRLRLDLRELRKKSGGFFGSGESTGSVGVVTINMPRIAYLSDGRSRLLQAARPADGHFRALAAHEAPGHHASLLDEGLYPYTQALPGHVRQPLLDDRPCRHERGVPEREVAARRHDAESRRRSSRRTCSTTCASACPTIRKQYGDLYNLEATPAESRPPTASPSTTSEQYPDIITADDQDGNAVLHQQLAPAGRLHRRHLRARSTFRTSCRRCTPPARCSTPSSARSCPTGKRRPTLVRKIAENYKLPYYTMSPDLFRSARTTATSPASSIRLPQLRRGDRSLQPHHRLLSPGAELERRQERRNSPTAWCTTWVIRSW